MRSRSLTVACEQLTVRARLSPIRSIVTDTYQFLFYIKANNLYQYWIEAFLMIIREMKQKKNQSGDLESQTNPLFECSLLFIGCVNCYLNLTKPYNISILTPPQNERFSLYNQT